MIKAESKGERSLRSASPHRNAYKSDFHAIKCSFDGTKTDSAAKSYANGSSDPREDTRGRPFGNRVNKIKNIFLQMDGQQQPESPEEKPVTSPVSPVSPVSKFPVSSNKTCLSSANNQEAQNAHRTPQGEEVEIDKATLAEKFSVTRKLFERGIKEQPERPVAGRVSTRLSQGRGSEEGCGGRRSLGSSENNVIKSPTSPGPVERRDDDDSKQVNRLSLNAGPISRRLENFVADSDNEDSKRASAKSPEKVRSPIEGSLTSPLRGISQKPTSPGADPSNKTVSPNSDTSKPFAPKTEILQSSVVGSPPFKSTSPVSSVSSKSTSPTSRSTSESLSPTTHSPFKCSPPRPASPQPRDLKPLPSPSSFYKSSRSPEVPKNENDVIQSPPRDKAPEQSQLCLDATKVGVVRAELVVVQNESSESEETEDELLDDVFVEVRQQRELKSEVPSEDFIDAPKVSSSQNHTEISREGEQQEDEEDACLTAELRREEANQEKDYDHRGENNILEDDEESEQEDPDECGKTSPAFYSFENAAFVDDKEGEPVLNRDDDDEEEDEDVYEVYDEMPGLSEEEERSPRRKIRFSTQPIRVRNITTGNSRKHFNTKLIVINWF